MGLAFLPWERLPAWLLGPLMVAVGVFLVLHAEPFSWRQFEAGGFIIIGMVVFIYGVKKLRAKSTADVTTGGK
jgi:uncharacterized membrane protein